MFAAVISNLKKLLRWGPRGLLSYIRERQRTRSLRMQLRRSLDCQRKPVRGITVVGKLTTRGSNSKTLRDLVMALSKTGTPYQTFDMSGPDHVEMPEFSKYQTPADEFVLNRYDHLIEFGPSVVGTIDDVKKARIIFWEFDSGLLYGYPDAPNEACVIAMSDFNAEYFRRILPQTRVVKLLYPFQYDSPLPVSDVDIVRQKYGFDAKDFIVYFNFDFGSGYNRKNPEGALRAFAKAFVNEPTAKFLMKTSGSKSHPDKVQRLRNLATELGVGDRLVLVDAFLAQQEIYDLVNAADVYLSLHRGEGFGITLAEAMAMGKPVVCTNWSATTEFCEEGIVLQVPYQMVPVMPEQIDHPFYHDVKTWAEADIDMATRYLHQLFSTPELCRLFGLRGEESVRRRFSSLNMLHSITNYLES